MSKNEIRENPLANVELGRIAKIQEKVLLEMEEKMTEEELGVDLYYQALKKHIEREKHAIAGLPVPDHLKTPQDLVDENGDEFQIIFSNRVKGKK